MPERDRSLGNHTIPSSGPTSPRGPRRIGILGAGRLGTALACALRDAGYEVDGPAPRGTVPGGEAVLLCVPDAEIPAAAATVAGSGAALVGHTSGATALSALAVAAGGGTGVFGLHPLQTLTGGRAAFRGCACAVGGSSTAALEAARGIALDLDMEPFEIADAQRPAYHAAASVASNFLVTLEATAERVAARAGMSPAEARARLAPLVRTTVDNWVSDGPDLALTGPVARGDRATVAAQRGAVAEAGEDLLPLFDVLVERTAALAVRGTASVAPTALPAGPDAITPALAGARGPGVRTVRTVADLRAALAGAPRPVGLVPTMGALHEGHLSLLRRARADCATVVMSLFVNPTQFAADEDLASYPRDEERDAALAAGEGADLIFAPPESEVFPPGFATVVEVSGITDVLEGDPASRGPGHFRGVATMVTKLLGMVGPDVAYFGQKDAQQALVIRRVVRDLDLPVQIEVLPTVREADGLAMSSRNAYLGAQDRERATALARALRAAELEVAEGERDADAVLAVARAELDRAQIEPEYLELRHADDLSPAEGPDGPILLAVAAQIGPARLIDNVVLEVREPAPSELLVTSTPGASSRAPARRELEPMRRTMLKSKIHRATITDSDLHYVGSITVDPDLLEAADILEHEQVAVLDVDNGARFETYTIAGLRGSGEVKVNGAAARLVHAGDTAIVVSYATYDREELAGYEPVVVHVDADNAIVGVDDAVAELLA